MSAPVQEVLKNDAVMLIVEIMYVEALRNGSERVAYQISNLLVKDMSFKLSDNKASVTFCQGEKDNYVPSQWAKLIKNEIPNSKLVTFPEEGHLIKFKHAKEIFTNLKP